MWILDIHWRISIIFLHVKVKHSIWLLFSCLFLNDGEREVWPVDVIVLNRDSFSPSYQIHILGGFDRGWPHHLDRHVDLLDRHYITQLVPGGEKLDDPSVPVDAGLVGPAFWILSLLIDIVPKLKVRLTFISFHKLLQDWSEILDILLESTVDIILNNILHFLYKSFPVF